MFAHQIMQGVTWHSLQVPVSHEFHYAYRFWAINLTSLDANPLPTFKLGKKSLTLPLFAKDNWALYQFKSSDYFDDAKLDKPLSNNSQKQQIDKATDISLLAKVNQTWQRLTGSQPTGQVVALVVLRNVGWYSSTVNFYIGFDRDKQPMHFLAEVSNKPWKKRHYYGFLLTGEKRCISMTRIFMSHRLIRLISGITGG